MQAKPIPIANPLDLGMVLYVILEDRPVNVMVMLAYTPRAHQEC